MKRLYDDATSGLGKIQFIALGVGTQTPVVSLTQLTNENIRSAIDPLRTVVSGTQLKVYTRF